MKFVKAGAPIIAVFTLFYLAFVHYTEPNEVAIVWNRVSGDIWLDETAGFNLTAPWTAVSRIDTRPSRVCITTAGRGFNCKLAQFEPRHYKELVRVEGFHYYWLANRLSFNSGYREEYRGMKDILRGHAFGAKKYPFARIVQDYVEPD
jgi:hypothetical protein